MSSLRNAVPRPAHKERHQPSSRKTFGLLEKHKDYVERANAFHKKQDTLRMYVTPPDTDVYSIPKVLAQMPQKYIRCAQSDFGCDNVTEPPVSARRDPLYKYEREIEKVFLRKHYKNRRLGDPEFVLDFEEIYVIDSKTKSITRAKVLFRKAPQGSPRKVAAQKQVLEAMSHKMHIDDSVKLVGKLLFGMKKGPEVLTSVRPAGQPLVDDWDCLKTLVPYSTRSRTKV